MVQQGWSRRMSVVRNLPWIREMSVPGIGGTAWAWLGWMGWLWLWG